MERSAFDKKGVEPAITELRYKHYRNKLIETLNRVLEQRRNIKMKTT